MRLRIALALALLPALAVPDTTDIAPVPPVFPSLNGTFFTVTPQQTTLASNGSACSFPSQGAQCVVILKAHNVAGWNKATVVVKNTGTANILTNVLVSVSPDGTNWRQIDSCGALAASPSATDTCRVSISGEPINWIRAEGRSASGTTVSAWLSLDAP